MEVWNEMNDGDLVIEENTIYEIDRSCYLGSSPFKSKTTVAGNEMIDNNKRKNDREVNKNVQDKQKDNMLFGIALLLKLLD